MESLNLDHTVLIAVALIASMTKLVRLLFASLRVCVKEYYDFRIALRVMKARAKSRDVLKDPRNK